MLTTLAVRLALAALLWGLAALAAFAEGPEGPPQGFWDRPAVRACCSDADAVYADEWAVRPDGSAWAKVTGGGPRGHAWAPLGRIYEIPPERILREPGNPTGRPLLFVNPASLHLYCFAVGAGI